MKNLKGTKFQIKVWNYLKKIPKGKLRTYSQVAKAINRPLAVRAVANAIGKNPFPPMIPCHRVVRSDGSLGGYSGKGGIVTKKTLLKKKIWHFMLLNYQYLLIFLMPVELTGVLFFFLNELWYKNHIFFYSCQVF